MQLYDIVYFFVVKRHFLSCFTLFRFYCIKYWNFNLLFEKIQILELFILRFIITFLYFFLIFFFLCIRSDSNITAWCLFYTVLLVRKFILRKRKFIFYYYSLFKILLISNDLWNTFHFDLSLRLSRGFWEVLFIF